MQGLFGHRAEFVGRSLSSITGEDPDFYLGVLSRRCAHKKMIAQGIIVNKKYGYDVQVNYDDELER